MKNQFFLVALVVLGLGVSGCSGSGSGNGNGKETPKAQSQREQASAPSPCTTGKAKVRIFLSEDGMLGIKFFAHGMFIIEKAAVSGGKTYVESSVASKWVVKNMVDETFVIDMGPHGELIVDSVGKYRATPQSEPVLLISYPETEEQLSDYDRLRICIK